MPAKMIVDRRRTARLLGAAARELSPEASPALASQFAPILEPGETMPDFPFLLELLARKLEETSLQVTSRHEGLKEELDRDISARRRRDEAAKVVREALGTIRSAVDGSCGKKVATEVLGYDGRTGQQAEELLLKAQRVLARLADGTFNLPLPRLPGIQLDTTSWPGLLAGPTADLERALNELGAGDTKTNNRSVGKQASVVGFDRLHQRTARLLQDLLKYADQVELAARVRLAYRKSRASAEEEPAPAPGDAPVSAPVSA